MLATELAEIIVVTLNNKSAFDFSQDFTAIRSYVPCWELKDLKEMRVTVLVPDFDEKRLTRGEWQMEATVQIGVQVKLDISPAIDPVDANTLMTTAADLYQLLLYEIAAVLKANPRQGEASMMTIRTIPYDTEHLQGQNVYTGLINLTYWMTGD